ncbi:hypothetical protein [Hungatella hathewayi]|uniref:DUF3592 domain-containing protein n=2 Tax=Hungatella hathewayi TaxID=154046 RepID=G5IMW6_9FIRM|nr:hypothetical protein [Hungatella hathewayi]EHI57149.1 hypothetical protein HMPREF9473_04844 [ [Hungatella hathewayi WAL-18680]
MVFCWIMSVGFAFILIVYIIDFFKAKKCDCTTLGTIIEIKQASRLTRYKTYICYRPIYKYKVFDTEYVNEFFMESDDTERYKLNDEVLLHYEKNNPMNFIPDGEMYYLKKNIIIFAILFLCFLMPSVSEMP